MVRGRQRGTGCSFDSVVLRVRKRQLALAGRYQALGSVTALVLSGGDALVTKWVGVQPPWVQWRSGGDGSGGDGDGGDAAAAEAVGSQVLRLRVEEGGDRGGDGAAVLLVVAARTLRGELAAAPFVLEPAKQLLVVCTPTNAVTATARLVTLSLPAPASADAAVLPLVSAVRLVLAETSSGSSDGIVRVGSMAMDVGTDIVTDVVTDVVTDDVVRPS